jgi:D-sedoheptulose 7-phosphate isomerase
MREFAEKYFSRLFNLLKSIRVTDEQGMESGLFEGIEKAGDLIRSQAGSGRKLIFIGNGASAAISSHMATDFWKNGGIKTTAFNDSSLLTCISNDYGYEHVFAKSIEMFADNGDILFAISSSGRSENILKGVYAAKSRECKVITLSGFKDDNPLSVMGDYNFYVPSQEYGHVEIIHHSICHSILDSIINLTHVRADAQLKAYRQKNIIVIKKVKPIKKYEINDHRHSQGFEETP